MSTSRIGLTVVAGVLTLTGPTACGSDDGAESTDATPDAAAFSELFKFNGVTDYEQMATPAEAGRVSDISALGTVESVSDGRRFIIMTDDPSMDDHSIVVGFSIDEVYTGTLPSGNDGKLYVELPNFGKRSIDDFLASYPEGSQAALYLTALPQDDPNYRDDAAGRPKGQHIWVPISPQGLVVEDGSGSIELLSQKEFAAPVEEFLPTENSFPEN